VLFQPRDWMKIVMMMESRLRCRSFPHAPVDRDNYLRSVVDLNGTISCSAVVPGTRLPHVRIYCMYGVSLSASDACEEGNPAEILLCAGMITRIRVWSFSSQTQRPVYSLRLRMKTLQYPAHNTMCHYENSIDGCHHEGERETSAQDDDFRGAISLITPA
jgi:hypothetical protein